MVRRLMYATSPHHRHASRVASSQLTGKTRPGSNVSVTKTSHGTRPRNSPHARASSRPRTPRLRVHPASEPASDQSVAAYRARSSFILYLLLINHTSSIKRTGPPAAKDFAEQAVALEPRAPRLQQRLARPRALNAPFASDRCALRRADCLAS